MQIEHVTAIFLMVDLQVELKTEEKLCILHIGDEETKGFNFVLCTPI